MWGVGVGGTSTYDFVGVVGFTASALLITGKGSVTVVQTLLC